MKEGAFALIDCLGWKGIWQQTTELALIDKISKISHKVGSVIEEINSRHLNMSSGPIRAQIRLISDTVAVSIQHETDSSGVDSLDKAYLVRTAALSVIEIQRLFLVQEPSIALRGCISYGEHLVIDNFIVGPAVDQAADYYETAEGALVWLLPSAGVHTNCADLLLHDIGSLYLQHKMPLKSGGRLETLVVNPLYMDSTGLRQSAINCFLEALRRVDRLDVWLKGQNTLEFLHAAEAASAEFEEKAKSAVVPGAPSQN